MGIIFVLAELPPRTERRKFAGKKFYAKIGAILGHGAMAAHRTLNPWILVRIQVPQPYSMTENDTDDPDHSANTTSLVRESFSCVLTSRGNL